MKILRIILSLVVSLVFTTKASAAILTTDDGFPDHLPIGTNAVEDYIFSSTTNLLANMFVTTNMSPNLETAQWNIVSSISQSFSFTTREDLTNTITELMVEQSEKLFAKPPFPLDTKHTWMLGVALGGTWSVSAWSTSQVYVLSKKDSEWAVPDGVTSSIGISYTYVWFNVPNIASAKVVFSDGSVLSSQNSNDDQDIHTQAHLLRLAPWILNGKWNNTHIIIITDKQGKTAKYGLGDGRRIIPLRLTIDNPFPIAENRKLSTNGTPTASSFSGKTLTVIGTVDRTVIIEASSDLANWQEIATLTIEYTGKVAYSELDETNSMRFYRVRYGE